MPDLDVTIKLSQLQEYEKELAIAKSRNRFLETSNNASQAGILAAQLKIEKLEAFIGSRGLKTGSSYNIYKLIDDSQKLNQELQETKNNREYLISCHFSSSEAYRNIIADLRSALAVEVSNVCDLDQEKQDLIEILADKNETIFCLKADKIQLEQDLKARQYTNYEGTVKDVYERKLEEQHQTLTKDFNLLNRVIMEKTTDITCLKAEKAQLETQLAATIARDTSFTLSGDYQVTKISKRESISNQETREYPQCLKSYKEMYPQAGFPPHLDENDTEFDDDIDDEPDPSIGW